MRMLPSVFHRAGFITICLGSIFSITSAQSSETDQEKKGPVIYCAEPVFEFGAVETGVTIQHVFLLENRGDENLLIKKILTRCGCTTFQLETKEILPGETLALPVELDLRGRRGPQNRGVYVESNAANQKMLVLALKGEAGTRLEIRPPVPILRAVSNDDRPRGSLEIRSPDTSPIRLTEVRNQPADLKVTALEQPDPGLLKIELQWSRTPPPGQHSSTITLATNHPNHPEIRVSILTVVQDQTTFHPGKVELPKTDGAQSILIRPPTGRVLRVLDVELPAPEIAWSAQQLPSGDLQLEFTGLDKAADVRGKSAHVHLDGDLSQTLMIPFE